MKKSLASEFPELAKEWDYEANDDLAPSDVPPVGRYQAYWVCPKGHLYRAKLASRAYGTGCPYCNGSKVTFERSIEGRRSDLLPYWDNKKILWGPTKFWLEGVQKLTGYVKRGILLMLQLNK